jgi:CheY-like chemotaxis protein
MQGWSGLQLLEQLRKHRVLKSVPVIILTADNRKTTFAEALNAGANSYLLKSHFSGESLIEKVQGVLSSRSENPSFV